MEGNALCHHLGPAAGVTKGWRKWASPGELRNPGSGCTVFSCPHKRERSKTEDMELSRVAAALGPTGQLLLFLSFQTLAAQAADTCPGETDLNFQSLQFSECGQIECPGLNPLHASLLKMQQLNFTLWQGEDRPQVMQVRERGQTSNPGSV